MLLYSNNYLKIFDCLAKCEVSVKSAAGYGLIAVLTYASFRPSPPCAAEKDELIISVNKSTQYNINWSSGDQFVTDSTDNDIAIKLIATNLIEAVDGKGFELYFTSYKLNDSSGMRIFEMLLN